MKLRRYLKWVAIGLGSLVGLVILFLLIVTLFFGDKVEQLFLRELNKQLATELTASRVTLNLFKSFPDAKLTFHDLRIRENIPESSNNVLEAQKLSFRFNIWDIIRGTYDVKSLEAEHGTLRLLTSPDGRVNYDVLKSSDEVGTSEQFELNLQTVVLNDINIRYLDERAGQDIALLIHDGQIRGNLTESRTTLEGKLDVMAERILIGEMAYFTAKPATFDLTLDVDFDEQRYTFKESHIVIEKDALDVSGSISSSDIDLSVEGKDLGIASFLAMLPVQGEQMQQFTSSGGLQFSATVKGPLENGSPAVDIRFELNDGTIKHPQLGSDLRNVRLGGSFTVRENSDWKKARLVLDPFTGEFDGQPFDCTVRITDLTKPKLDIGLNAIVDLDDWSGLLTSDHLGNFSGSLAFDHVRIYASYSDNKFTNIVSSGKLSAYDVTFSYLNKDVTKLNSTLTLNNELMRFEELHFLLDDMPFRLKGTFTNGIAFIIGQVFSGRSDPLRLNVVAAADWLDLDELLHMEWPSATKTTPTPTATRHFPLLDMFEGTASLATERFNFREFDAEDVISELNFSPGVIRFGPCSANTVDGRISLSGEARVHDGTALQIAGDARCRNIDIRKLFKACEDFDQHTLVSENLKGTGHADIVFVTWWDTNMIFQPELMTVAGDLDIMNGELLGFEPMNDLSAYIKVKELEHIQFERLKNRVEIRDETVTIPTMLIRSSAMNLLMTGNHTFDNRIEYYFKINMLDVLARKFRFGKSTIGDIEDINESLINVYIAMSGTVDEPIIRTDKKLVKQKLNLEAFDPTHMPYDWKPPKDTLEFIEW